MSREVEKPIDHAVAGRILEGRAVVLVAQQKAERTQQDGLSGSRFARDDVQMRVELHFEPVDQGVIFDGKTA